MAFLAAAKENIKLYGKSKLFAQYRPVACDKQRISENQMELSMYILSH